jgi:hypothetical protein
MSRGSSLMDLHIPQAFETILMGYEDTTTCGPDNREDPS